jgi:hypothetical protein
MCAYRDTRDADDWMATDRFFHSFKVADEDAPRRAGERTRANGYFDIFTKNSRIV